MKKIVLAFSTLSAFYTVNYANIYSSTVALFGPNQSVKQQHKITNQEIIGLVDALPIVKKLNTDIIKRWGNKHTVGIRIDQHDQVKNQYKVNVSEVIEANKSILKYTFIVDGHSKKVLNPDGKAM